MVRYRLFALDPAGRVDRGFEKLFTNDDDAIGYAKSISDAAMIEVMRDRKVIAHVRHQNGQAVVVPVL